MNFNLEFIERLAPQWMIAAAVLLIGIVVIFYRSPQATYCDSQKEAFIQSEQKFLMSRRYKKFFDRCLYDSRPGACKPYFDGMNGLIDHFSVIDDSCFKEVAGGGGRIQKVLTDFILETTRIAWGDEGPSTMYAKGAWFGPDHLKVICRARSAYQKLLGEPRYKLLEKRIVKLLPEGKGPSRFRGDYVAKYQNTLLSVSCSKYL